MAFSVREVRAIVSVLSVLATVAVAARFRVRRLLKAKYEADDWTILASLLLAWALTAMVLRGTMIGVYGGYFPRTAVLTDGLKVPIETLLKFHFSMWLLAVAGVGMIKISVLLLYRRLFFAERFFHIYATCLCVLVALWALGFFFARIFMVGVDPSAHWTRFKADKHDIIAPVSNGFGISNIIADGLVVLSPIPIVVRLRLPKLQRLGVVGIFALGFLSTAAGAARGYIVITANQAIAKNRIHPVVLGTQVAVWSVIETTIAVIAACLVTLRPLVSGDHAGSWIKSIKSAISLFTRSEEEDRRSGKEHTGGLRDIREEDEAELHARLGRPEAFSQA